MKKFVTLSALILTVVMLAGTVGCRHKDDSIPASTAELPATRTFTDSVGRTVEIPYTISRVAISGPLTQIIFYGFAPELLVGWCDSWSTEAAKFIPEKYLSLPTLGQLYGSKGQLNLEELLAAAPDVVVDIGEPKGTVREDLDALSAQTGIPFVHITATTAAMGDAVRKLGELTGLSDRAEEYASYLDSKLAMIQNIMAKVGDNKVRALYCLGDAGCNVIARGSYHAEIIDLITDNLAIVDNPSSKGSGNEVDLEQIMLWSPDLIIFASDSIYDTVASDPVWNTIPAIQSGNYVEAPSAPYNWMGFPPGVQRCLGMFWLTSILYPDYCDFDLRTEVQTYYRMFYHTELTDAQYAELMAHAVIK